MQAIRTATPVVVVGVILSAVIVLVGGVMLLRPDDLVGTDKDWARFDGVVAMAFFAFMAGVLSTAATTALSRWLPLGLLAFAAVAIGLGVYVSAIALDSKPALAPMFIALHVVFVGAFGIVLPYRLYVTRSAPSGGALRPTH